MAIKDFYSNLLVSGEEGAFGKFKNPLVGRFSDIVDKASPACEPFIQIMLEALELHTSKSIDYGNGEDPYANVRASEDFGVPAWQGSVIRANDKIVRIKSYLRNGSLKHETIEDSILDLCVYWPIILMLFREEKSNVNRAAEGTIQSCEADGRTKTACKGT